MFIKSDENWVIVIGSGPAGVACAMGLLDAGHKVKMLDRHNPNFTESIEKLNDLDAAYFSIVKGNGYKSHWSDQNCYNFDDLKDQSDQQIISSKSKGGFSNVWGRSCLPYTDRELEKWPLTYKDLEPWYEKVYKNIIDLHSESGFDDQFPKCKSTKLSLPVLSDIGWLKTNLSKYFSIVNARIALNKPTEYKCNGCGHCLVGCHLNILYDSRTTLDNLKSKYADNFIYTDNLNVLKFSSQDGKITVYANNLDGSKQEFSCQKLYIGAGVLSTLKIVTSSLIIRENFQILDSQYFIMPFLSFKKLNNFDEQSKLYHSSTQFYGEMLMPESNNQYTHLLFYLYNEVYLRKLLTVFPNFKILHKVLNFFIDRLGIVQGFIHSDYSSSVDISVSNKGLFFKTNSLKNIVHKVKWALSWRLLKAKLIPMTPIFSVKLPGQSFHNGGSLPMGKDTSLLGELKGANNVFIIDASTFPTIPGPTITLTVMANAYRIGAST